MHKPNGGQFFKNERSALSFLPVLQCTGMIFALKIGGRMSWELRQYFKCIFQVGLQYNMFTFFLTPVFEITIFLILSLNF